MNQAQKTLSDKEPSSVYLTLLRPYDLEIQKYSGKYDKTIAVQKCGEKPYELALRFGGCILRCGACFAATYSWPERFRDNPRVTHRKNVQDAVEDYKKIPYPSGHSRYNWMRILGGEPFLNDYYINFLFDVLINISKIDSKKFNNGVVIQTNGIHIGKGNVDVLKTKLQELHETNPSVKIVIEVSIKGTNLEEFKLISRAPDIHSQDYFSANIGSYFILKELANSLPNLRPVIIAGYGVNEKYLLTEGNSADMITIIFKDNKPIYHPDFWSKNFKKLYDDFTSTYKSLDPMFSKMPMYGIKDQYGYGWVMAAIKRGRGIYKDKWYDKKYAPERYGRNIALETSFVDILDKFFLVDNQKYYSTLIK